MGEVLDQCRISPLGCCHGIGRSAEARRPASVRPLAKAPAPTPRRPASYHPVRAHPRPSSLSGRHTRRRHTHVSSAEAHAGATQRTTSSTERLHAWSTHTPATPGRPPRADATTAPTRIAVHPLPHTPAAQTPRDHARCSLHRGHGAPGHTHRELHRPTSRCSTMYDTACLHPVRYAGLKPRVSPGQGPPRARSPPFGRILWRRWSHRGLCCTRCTEGAPGVAAYPTLRSLRTSTYEGRWESGRQSAV